MRSPHSGARKRIVLWVSFKGSTLRIDLIRRFILLLCIFMTCAGSETHGQPTPDDVVDIKGINPHILVDMKYAGTTNFAHRKFYQSNTCFLRRSTALKLEKVEVELERMGLGLKLWDCYRPVAVQRSLWAILPDERHVANPKKGSRHNRAAAVDLTLVDLQGREVEMGTGFDDFTLRAHRSYSHLPAQVIRNRDLLEDLMRQGGFVPLAGEWWHYDDAEWSAFGLLNFSF